MSVPQKRLRLRYKDVKEGEAYMNPEMMKFLGLEDGDQIEVVVAKRKLFTFRVHPKNDVPRNEVWTNPDILRENGIADKEDRLRPYYLVSHIYQIHRALQSGVFLKGYLHWTLVDTYEFSKGRSMRFGLIHVDYTNKKLYWRPSAFIYKEIAENKAITNGRPPRTSRSIIKPAPASNSQGNQSSVKLVAPTRYGPITGIPAMVNSIESQIPPRLSKSLENGLEKISLNTVPKSGVVTLYTGISCLLYTSPSPRDRG